MPFVLPKGEEASKKPTKACLGRGIRKSEQLAEYLVENPIQSCSLRPGEDQTISSAMQHACPQLHESGLPASGGLTQTREHRRDTASQPATVAGRNWPMPRAAP